MDRNIHDSFGYVLLSLKMTRSHEVCMCYHVKCFNFSSIRIRTDLHIKIRIRRMRILINSVTSLFTAAQYCTSVHQYHC